MAIEEVTMIFETKSSGWLVVHRWPVNSGGSSGLTPCRGKEYLYSVELIHYYGTWLGFISQSTMDTTPPPLHPGHHPPPSPLQPGHHPHLYTMQMLVISPTHRCLMYYCIILWGMIIFLESCFQMGKSLPILKFISETNVNQNNYRRCSQHITYLTHIWHSSIIIVPPPPTKPKILYQSLINHIQTSEIGFCSGPY